MYVGICTTSSRHPRHVADATSRSKQLVAFNTASAASTTYCSVQIAPIQIVRVTLPHVPTPSTIVTRPPRALQQLVDASLCFSNSASQL